VQWTAHTIDGSRPVSSIGPAARPSTSRRGPDAVRRRLIDATLELISHRSPATVTNKEIAALAGVNHGQIHHYFDPKDDLVAHAILEASIRLMDEGPTGEPRPLSYNQASIGRALAYLAVSSDSMSAASPIVTTLVEREAAARNVAVEDTELLADAAAFVTLSYGWAVFEDLLVDSLAELGVDRESLRRTIADRSATVFASGRIDPRESITGPGTGPASQEPATYP
jgi:AcrR family transcriptional regulator